MGKPFEDAKSEQAAAEELQRKGYEIITQLVPSLQVWYKVQLTASKDDPALFTKMATVALLNAAGVLGVDVGMGKDQFLSVCASCYDDANVKAPRFS